MGVYKVDGYAAEEIGTVFCFMKTGEVELSTYSQKCAFSATK